MIKWWRDSLQNSTAETVKEVVQITQIINDMNEIVSENRRCV